MIARLNAREKKLGDQIIDLDCRIALTKPRTKFEYATIVQEINDAIFERSDLIELAWRLGREAVALGISTPPKLDVVDREQTPRLLPCVRRKRATGKATADAVEQTAAR